MFRDNIVIFWNQGEILENQFHFVEFGGDWLSALYGDTFEIQRLCRPEFFRNRRKYEASQRNVSRQNFPRDISGDFISDSFGMANIGHKRGTHSGTCPNRKRRSPQNS